MTEPTGLATQKLGLYGVEIKMSQLETVSALIDGVIEKQRQLESLQGLIVRGQNITADIAKYKHQKRSNFQANVHMALKLPSLSNLDHDELCAILPIRLNKIDREIDALLTTLRSYNVNINRDGPFLKTVSQTAKGIDETEYGVTD